MILEGPIKSCPKLISEILSPATTQFQMKSSPDTLNELENIRALASKFLESYVAFEACVVDPDNIERPVEATSKGTSTMQLEIAPQPGEETEIDN